MLIRWCRTREPRPPVADVRQILSSVVVVAMVIRFGRSIRAVQRRSFDFAVASRILYFFSCWAAWLPDWEIWRTGFSDIIVVEVFQFLSTTKDRVSLSVNIRF